MSEFESHIEVIGGSEKGFGIVFAVVFSLIGLYPLISGNDCHYWALGVAATFLALAYFAPKLLSAPNRLWFKLGILLGSIIAPLVMGLVYFTTIAPIGLIMRLFGKDLLKQKLDKNAKSYWIKREHPVSTMKDQF